MQAMHESKPKDLKHDHMTHDANDQIESKQPQIMQK